MFKKLLNVTTKKEENRNKNIRYEYSQNGGSILKMGWVFTTLESIMV